jgi:hypothetical protein
MMDEEILVASNNEDEVDIEAAAAKTTVHNGVRGTRTGQNR